MEALQSKLIPEVWRERKRSLLFYMITISHWTLFIAIIVSALGLTAAFFALYLAVKISNRPTKHLADGTYRFRKVGQTPEGDDLFEVEDTKEPENTGGKG